MAPEGELAVDDRPAQAALGVVVGGLDSGNGGEGPQSGPALEQVTREDPIALGLRAFQRRLLKQRPKLLFQRADPIQQAGAITVPPELVPDLKHPFCDLQPR